MIGIHFYRILVLSGFLFYSSLAIAVSDAKKLEYFSYCSNGNCRLITGAFFHKMRGMPVDLNVVCKKNNQYALTFDDGPSKNYPRLLQILKINNVKATFFIVGSQLQNKEAVAWFQQAFADGHFMANHTFGHNDLTQLDEKAIVETIEKSREAMIKAIYPEGHQHSQDFNYQRLENSSKLIRPPFGNIDMRIDAIFKAHGYSSVRWNADRYDWNMPGDDPRTTETILARVRLQLDYINENIAHGRTFNQSILDLNHDWQPTTIEALQDLITTIKSRGYEFVTLDQCLNL